MAKKTKIVKLDIQAHPHNGDNKPHLQFPDPVNGEAIGGQVAAMRMAMRVRHVALAWARRQGKSRTRQFLIMNEACITSGLYRFGMVLPNHQVAYKLTKTFIDSWGGLVKNFKNNNIDQDRWVELHPIVPPHKKPPTWFTPQLEAKWERCFGGDPNTGTFAHFWSGKHPHYESIQGDMFPYNRIDWDECAQIHPMAYPIIRPMLRDVKGSEMFTGTPMHQGIGNVQFERWWDNAGGGDPIPDWFRMRIPDGTNPHVPAVTPDEMRTMSDRDIRQTVRAEFLTGEGAVFSNLDNIFVLKPLHKDNPETDWIKAIRSSYSMPSIEWWIYQSSPIEGHIYGASVDWARSPKGDYTAMTVFDFTTGRQVALFRWRGEDMSDQMMAAYDICTRYGAGQLHSDANGVGLTVSDFIRKRHSLNFIGHKWGRNKESYVTRGRVLFQDGDIEMIGCMEQRAEFKNYSAFEAEGLGSDKQIKYCAPQGEHDDIVSCFLQLAPTLTIIGKQDRVEPEEEAVPMFDQDNHTTLAQFTGGSVLPWDSQDASAGNNWNSIILPPKY